MLDPSPLLLSFSANQPIQQKQIVKVDFLGGHPSGVKVFCPGLCVAIARDCLVVLVLGRLVGLL